MRLLECTGVQVGLRIFCSQTPTKTGFLALRPISFFSVKHGWASAELPRNRVSVNLFLRHIWDVSR